MKLLSIVLVGTIFTLLVVGHDSSSRKRDSALTERSRKGESVSSAVPATSYKLKTIVDGKSKPDKIPDHVGYSLLFAIVSGRTNDVDKQRARAFIKRIELDEREIDQLIAAAEEFRERAHPLEFEGDTIKRRTHPNHLPLKNEEKSRLIDLQKQRDDLTNQVADSLDSRLGKNSANKVRHFIRSVMKRNVKIME